MKNQGEGKAGLHWTYGEPSLAPDLRQGDIIRKTQTLADVLKEKLSAGLADETTHVLVLTQSCDLARRGAKSCKSPNILVAPVLPVWRLIIAQIASYQSEVEAYAGICRQSAKADLRLFLERLLNNNEEEYFYLHPDADLGVANHSYAHIRLCFGLDACLYYEHLRENRALRLKEPFANKLGWHMGWLYARVGTEDWVPDHSSRQEFN